MRWCMLGVTSRLGEGKTKTKTKLRQVSIFVSTKFKTGPAQKQRLEGELVTANGHR